MVFRCPVCQASGLTIAARIELPPDSRSDEITAQILHCNRCDFKGAGVYEESRRGSLWQESVDHRGYHVSKQAGSRLAKLIASCPRPQDPHCTCTAHLELGRQAPGGRWVGLEPFDLSGRFEMQPLS